ncbi:hypothetical protein HDV05_003139, partial [Chytridiales sp. JEL 0842]
LAAALRIAERKQAEVEEALQSQVQFLSENYKQAFEDVKKLSTVNADLLGHQNAQQKIRHIAKLKEELMKTKEDLVSVTKDRDTLRRKHLVLERDLEAYASLAQIAASTANAAVAAEGATLAKPSKAKRAVLAARGQQQQTQQSAGAGGKSKVAGLTIPKPWKQKHLHGGVPTAQKEVAGDDEESFVVESVGGNAVEEEVVEDKENAAGDVTGTAFFVGI